MDLCAVSIMVSVVSAWAGLPKELLKMEDRNDVNVDCSG